MSLLRIYSILLLISEKQKTQSRENKHNSPDMESALRAAWLGLLLLFTVSQASLSSALTAESDSLYIWNDTLP